MPLRSLYYRTRRGIRSVYVMNSTHSNGVLSAAEFFNVTRKSDGIESTVELFQSLQLFIENGESGQRLFVDVPAAG